MSQESLHAEWPETDEPLSVKVINQYLAARGPTNPWRIARDLGIDEGELLKYLSTRQCEWHERERIAGPGQNYLVQIYK